MDEIEQGRPILGDPAHAKPDGLVGVFGVRIGEADVEPALAGNPPADLEGPGMDRAVDDLRVRDLQERVVGIGDAACDEADGVRILFRNRNETLDQAALEVLDAGNE